MATIGIEPLGTGAATVALETSDAPVDYNSGRKETDSMMGSLNANFVMAHLVPRQMIVFKVYCTVHSAPPPLCHQSGGVSM